MGRQLVKLLKVGKIKYGCGLHLQQHFVQLHKTTTENQNTLIIVEHPHVYTTGIRDKNYSQSEEENLKHKGAEFYRTNRGGLITYHGPGQLVAYPILNLHNFNPRIHWYIDKIEKTILNLCKKFKLEAELLGDRGVWIKDKKVFFVKLKVVFKRYSANPEENFTTQKTTFSDLFCWTSWFPLHYLPWFCSKLQP
ncbi:putative lipoyltransferase 2, mitochondrial isoform X2 [Diabrotica virgifera virgifera]|uniref:lipoyl(octanoyl) transferase n=1 Tax=Diabrotica virgifera virgifera TaxID=50390 RepID=A0A6P7GHU7_DIAVI|nr:putative lipoyltransferase 2, mitochondrial isoform X2 [Diabrotica virgifera virgifera]